MKTRCLNNKSTYHSNYGARGITVCNRWLRFENFRNDMLISYREHEKRHGEKNTTLEKVINAEGYSPQNCKWATRAEQMRNTRKNILLTFRGRIQCLSDWADEIGIQRPTLWYRVKNGWPVERALTTFTKSTDNKRHQHD